MKNLEKLIENIKLIKGIFTKDILQKIKNTRIFMFIKLIFFDNISEDNFYCQNKKILAEFCLALLSNKNYIILEGPGGFGKTTMVKLFSDNQNLDSALNFAEVINTRDFYDWSRIKDKVKINTSKKIFIIDNFNVFNQETLNYINKIFDSKQNKKIIIVCRKNEVPIINAHTYTLINCNIYKYSQKQLQKILFSRVEKRIQNSLKVKLIVRKLFKFFPTKFQIPFYFKLISYSLQNNNKDQVISKLEEIMQISKHHNKVNTTDNDFISSLIDCIFQFANHNGDKFQNLFLFSLIVQEIIFDEYEFNRIFDGTNVHKDVKNILNQDSFITSHNDDFFMHSIFVEYFLNSYEKYSTEDKISLLNSKNFLKITQNISDLLEVGRAEPYDHKIRYLSFVHNIYKFLYNSCQNDNVILQNLNVTTKQNIVETLNSYSLLLSKMCNNIEELNEAENVQNLLIHLFCTIPLKEYSPIEEYHSALNRFYNVLTKIHLSKFVLLKLQESDLYEDSLKKAEENLQNSWNEINKIENKKQQQSREEVMHYTSALLYYKKALCLNNNHRPGVMDQALRNINLSEDISINNLVEFMKDNGINDQLTMMLKNSLRNYNTTDYRQFKNNIYNEPLYNELITKLNSHIATLELKCIILFLRLYFKDDFPNDINYETIEETEKIIEFTLDYLDNDVMRQRELKIVQIEFNRILRNKYIAKDFSNYIRDQNNEIRYTFMKNMIMLLTEDFKINEAECQECCAAYSMDNKLFEKKNYNNLNKQIIEKYLYLLLTF